MTLLYKIFGIPQTLDEFADNVKRKKLSKVMVRLEDDFYPGGLMWNGRWECHESYYYVEASAGKLHFKAKDPDHSRLIKHLNGLEKRIYDFEQIFFQRMCLDVAERIQNNGLEVVLKGYYCWGEFDELTIDEARNISSRYEQRLEES